MKTSPKVLVSNNHDFLVLSSAIANNQDTSIAGKIILHDLQQVPLNRYFMCFSVLSTNVIRETRSAFAKKKAAKGKKNQKKKSMRRRRKGKANGKGRKKAFRGKEIKKARNGKSKRKTGRTAFRQSDDCVKVKRMKNHQIFESFYTHLY